MTDDISGLSVPEAYELGRQDERMIHRLEANVWADIRAEERERCAIEVESWIGKLEHDDQTCRYIAAAIRALS